MLTLQSILGVVVFIALAWVVSENRRQFPLRLVAVGLGLQWLLAALLLKLPTTQKLFFKLNGVVTALEKATETGASFVFGYLAGGPFPFELTDPGASFILAFRGLPLVLIVSALASLLFYWKVLPVVVRGFSWLLRRSLGIGGAEGLGVSANIFVGMIEAPLMIQPYLVAMTRSELFSLMTVGMATIAGTMMVLYASVLEAVVPNALGHILTASVISAPAAIVIAKVMVPADGHRTEGEPQLNDPPSSAMDAITKGTLRGVELLISIIAMLIVLVALIALVNMVLGLLPNVGGAPITLQRALGVLLAPVAWLLGIPWSEAMTGGSLLGTKTILNEFLAYLELGSLPSDALSDRSRTILLYALCGFANPGSLGIMIGGMGSMAPGRRSEIVELGFRSIVAGTLATCMTGAVVSVLI